MDQEKSKKNPSFSVLESIALEIESLSRDVKAALLNLEAPEKAAGLCAFVMFWSGFLPWFSTSGTHAQSGLDGFAPIHFGISVAVFFLLQRLAKQRGRKRATLEPGRIALVFLALGALSTITCIALLIHFGDLVAYAHGPTVVRYGFYAVLASGIGISGCGIGKLR